VVLMAVADTTYRFMYVDISSYGKDCDYTIFKRSTLWKSIQTIMLELPSEKPLSGTEGPHVPHFFVGDEGFALNTNILRSFGGSNLSVKISVCNFHLCRLRSYVECAFGILSNKWRIFQRPFHVSPDFAVVIANACVVLHNFIRERDGCNFEDAVTVTGLEYAPDGQSVRWGLTANSVRNKAADYFLKDAGAVP